MGESTRPLRLIEGQNSGSTDTGEQLSMLAEALRKSSPPPDVTEDGGPVFDATSTITDGTGDAVSSLLYPTAKKPKKTIKTGESTAAGLSFASARERRRRRMEEEAHKREVIEAGNDIDGMDNDNLGSCRSNTAKRVHEALDPSKKSKRKPQKGPRKISKKAQKFLREQEARFDYEGFERLSQVAKEVEAEMREEGSPRFRYSTEEIVALLMGLGDEDPITFENVATLLLLWRRHYKAHYNDAFVDVVVRKLLRGEKIGSLLQEASVPQNIRDTEASRYHAPVRQKKNGGEPGDSFLAKYVGPAVSESYDPLLEEGCGLYPGDPAPEDSE